MGNYADLEIEFIERTMSLLDQYNFLLIENDIPFKEQFNYTLLINCLLGLIVMPRERVFSYIPTTPLTAEFKNEIGLVSSTISSQIRNLRDLIKKLRHSVAHFDFVVLSTNEEFLIDEIVFRDLVESENREIVKFKAEELFGFLRYYSDCLISNLRKYRDKALAK